MAFTISDLLAMTYKPVHEYGDSFAADLARWVDGELANASAQQDAMVSNLTEQTTQRRRAWGSFLNDDSHEIKSDLQLGKEDEPPANGQTITVPLYKFDKTFVMTQENMFSQTPADIAKEVKSTQLAVVRRTILEMQFALFNSTAWTHFIDWLIDGEDLTHCVPFALADSLNYPVLPNGSEVDSSTHTHYSGFAGGALASSDIDAVLENVREHFSTADVALYINAGNISTLAGLAGTKLVRDGWDTIIANIAADHSAGKDSRRVNRNNTPVGSWDGYPVETKPFVPANYYMAVCRDAAEKPLLYRKSTVSAHQGVQKTEFSNHPLYGREYRWYYGFNPYNRVACAFLDGAHAAYNIPSGMPRVAA